MNTKNIIVFILIIAIMGSFTAPPAKAELTTLSVILAAAYATVLITNETINSEREEPKTSKTDQPDSFQQASSEPATP